MCTAVLHWSAQRVLAVANRDERRDRAPELPPAIAGDRIRRLCPRDGARGGTWCGVNDRGVIALLLNGYADGDTAVAPDAPSRGAIVDAVLGRSVDDVGTFLDGGFDPSPYPSFTLVVASRSGARCARWTPERTWQQSALPAGWSLFTSSSWRGHEVRAWRAERFAEWRDAGAPHVGRLPTFNLLAPAGREAWSPWMSRDASATRSITRLEIGADAARVETWHRDRETIDPAQPTRACTLPLRTSRGRAERAA